MATSVPQKRKPPSSRPDPSNARPSKRAKTLKDARKIIAEPPDKALGKNGDLDVAAFVKAREFEIRSIGKSMKESKSSLSTRAFQQVPRAMRRRTASHNVKKIPKRLQARVAREMKEDNTPTGAARRKKPATHKRLRLEKAKELRAKGLLTKAKREAEKKSKLGEADPKNIVQSTSRLPRAKKNTLIPPKRPPARFRKRQVHKAWLPTHVWHAKRAHMTEPKYPLWRFAIPLSPTEKCFRTTHRAAAMRGCVAWDVSYMSTIGLEGVEASLLGLLRSIGLKEEMLTGTKGLKWRRGTRTCAAWIRERDKPEEWIAPVTTLWCARDEEGHDEQKRKAKRKLLLRLHPSAFFQTWNNILKVAKMQRPSIMVEDLRFELGSIEITGAGSTEALIAALQPSPDKSPASTEEANPIDTSMPDVEGEASAQHEWEDIETPPKVWPKLAGLTNSSALPANIILAFTVADPRLRLPAQTTPVPSSDEACDILLHLLADWPPDQTQSPADIFDRTRRLTACRHLASQKSINRRRGAALPGQDPDPSPRDPQIPVLLYTSRPGSNKSAQSIWTLVLPWDCVLPVWYTLMHYPLSTGGTPRFGCLAEQRQIAFENSGLWFPGDFPGTKAGWEWELRERDTTKKGWERKPKGRRVEFSSVDLGEGRKGELGRGWACDWERLVLGKEKYEELEANEEAKIREAIEKDDRLASQAGDNPRASPLPSSPQTIATGPESPPYDIQQLSSLSLPDDKTNLPSKALAPIHIHLLPSGHPARCARIYRLPTGNPQLHQRWLSLHPNNKENSKSSHRPKNKQPHHHPPDSTSQVDLPAHERAQTLASTLLSPPQQWVENNSRIKPGHPSYPPVPDETDLIGFVTSANYHLGEGKCAAVGNVLANRAPGLDIDGNDAAGVEEGEVREVITEGAEEGEVVTQTVTVGQDRGARNGRGKGIAGHGNRWKGRKMREEGKTGGLCIVREAGQPLGRLARWEFAV